MSDLPEEKTPEQQEAPRLRGDIPGVTFYDDPGFGFIGDGEKPTTQTDEVGIHVDLTTGMTSIVPPDAPEATGKLISVGSLDEPAPEIKVVEGAVPATVRQYEMNTLMTLSAKPFDDPRPSDLLIKVAGRNEAGWILEASNNTEHLPGCDAQMASWLIAQLSFMPGNDIKVGNIYHGRINPLDYQRNF